MKILAFDTSASACSVALLNGDEVKALHEVAPMQQAKRILPIIQDLIATSSLKLNELDAIAYGCGPGSFTGTRIANSVAQGIGFAAGLPIIPISSLAAMAQAAFLERQWTRVLVAVDARMKQIYWAIYEVNQQGCVELIGQEQLCPPDEIKLPDNKHDWYGVGDGWEKYKETLVKRLAFDPTAIHSAQLPTAQALLSLARPRFDQKNWVRASDAIPVYLR